VLPPPRKVVVIALASGQRLCIEGSANLGGNGSAREQFALIHDAALAARHAGWIAEMVAQHHGKGEQGPD
jgi:hypothetical protein